VEIFLHKILSCDLIKHIILKETAVSAILTAEGINDTIHVIVDYRVSICPFNVNVTDTFLPHGVSYLHNTLNDCSAEHDVAGITARIYTVQVEDIGPKIRV